MYVLLAIVVVIALFIAVLLVRDHRSRAGGEVDYRQGEKPTNVRGDLRARSYMEGRSGTFGSRNRYKP